MLDTHNYNSLINHCIEQLSAVTNESEWMSEILDLINQLGVEHFLFSILESKESPLESAIIRSNYHQEWRQIYDYRKYAYIDPTVAHCMKTNIPYLWGESSFQTIAQKSLFHEASNFNLDKGMIFPIHGPNGGLGMCTFVFKKKDHEKFSHQANILMPYLTLIKEYIFISALKLFKFKDSNTPHLTPREAEIIKWTAAGKTCWEISVILGCSQSTINFHMNNLREKFNVRSKHEILMHALIHHLINF